MDASLHSFAFYAVALPAVFLLGLSKGGFAGIGLLSLPLIALVIPPLQAASVMLPILIVQDMVGVYAYRRSWDGWNLMILVPGAIVGILAAYLLAAEVSEAGVEFVLGIISVLFAARQLFILAGGRAAPAHRPGSLFGFLCGIGSGFTSMIAHAGAPPFQMFLIPQKLPRDVFVGTGIIFFAAVNLIKVPPFIALGQITHETLVASATLIPFAIISTWIGIWLVRRVSADRFYKIIYTLLLLVGIQLIWNGWTGL
ncbi:sulfite exporter TauE/SafE family protein [Propylenella binzhouense]|uniref:Probable membrane transporter protein n=1 Tax=Propylenella binzhouense TaxID=2555902 RepID=A0A964WSM0_9HYPH|nr:sulfite exporter TauE/SafE family protein [Propylenella binzhouense]MYZ47016.1 sulfite exporter TauE/SafE family protein [Propylenella binzhouense]